MSDKNNYAGDRLLTTEFRASFLNVFTPKAAKAGAEPRYSVVMLFKKGDPFIQTLKAAVETVARKRWGNNIPKKLKLPFRDGDVPNDNGVVYEGHQGHITISAWTKETNRPGVVDQNVQVIIDQTAFKSGDYARATITPFAYDGVGNPGVGFFLNNIQKLRTGEAFGGYSPPEADFDAVPVPPEDNTAIFGPAPTMPQQAQQTQPQSPAPTQPDTSNGLDWGGIY